MQHVFFGRVQGVGFRATAARVASGFAVTGWVRNEGDGSVKMEVQGSFSDIVSMIAKLREMKGSYITSETSSATAVAEAEVGFTVKY